MCGRYFIDENTYDRMMEIAQEAGLPVVNLSGRPSRAGREERRDVLPSQKVPVLTDQGFRSMQWGFHMQQAGSLLINARAETAAQKKTFSQSLLHRRCIIPAAGYYEWNPAREKVTFRRRDRELMFFAGLYRYEEEDPRYCILTTRANLSTRMVHDRMPLILDKAEIADWLCRPESSAALLKKEPAALDREQDYEQLTFSFD
ncbi:MAG: SOS response-associated peptidase [Lachnospiraceae bacterium]|nr:SOS response-associated peptidase [Lachnospiraceae bacterium]